MLRESRGSRVDGPGVRPLRPLDSARNAPLSPPSHLRPPESSRSRESLGVHRRVPGSDRTAAQSTSRGAKLAHLNPQLVTLVVTSAKGAAPPLRFPERIGSRAETVSRGRPRERNGR
eukprot:2624171-Pyramimonas_sp.AAC.1